MAAADETRQSTGRTDEGDIVIRFPRIDPEVRDWLLDLLPGRALLRVLCNLPDDFMQHTRAARRERLLALRSILDALIQETERPARRPRAREVEVE